METSTIIETENNVIDTYIGCIEKAYSDLIALFKIKPTIKQDNVVIKHPQEVKSIKYPYFLTSVLNNEFVCILKKAKNKNIIENSILKALADFITKSYSIDEIKDISNKDNESKLYESTKNYINQYVNALTFNSLSLINEISNSKYESSLCKGTISFKQNFEADSLLDMDFGDDKGVLFSKENKHLFRKLLEITNDNLYLSVVYNSDDNKVYCKQFVSHDPKNIELKFKGINHWEIYQNDSIIIEFNNDKYSEGEKQYIENDDKQKITEFLSSARSILTYEHIDKFIFELKNKSNNSFHGALLVITDDENFSKNMCSNSRAIGTKKHICLQDQKSFQPLLNQLCNIDGALVFNTDGILQSFGTILDGCVVTPGDRSRGSRFNSAKTFTEYYNRHKSGHHYLSIVMSEDGPIKVFDGKIKTMKNQKREK